MTLASLRTGSLLGGFLAALILLAAMPCLALKPPASPPAELVRLAVQTEIKAQNSNQNYMCREYRKTPRGTQTRLMVETRQAMAAIVIANDGKPLTAEQQQEEMRRVERFIKNPEEMQKKQKQEKENAERVTRIVKALPDAFLYEYGDSSEVGSEGVGNVGDELLRLNFVPNPAYRPPSRIEEVLTVMQGHLLIDPHANRIAKIDGTLAKDVGFGWGILGHLDHGGHFLVDQMEVGPAEWRITRMELAVTGKILIFKSLNIQTTEVYSDFHSVSSDLTFAQGIELLKKQEAVLAENDNASGTAQK